MQRRLSRLAFCLLTVLGASLLGAQPTGAELTTRAYLPILSTRAGNLPNDPCFSQQWSLFNTGDAGGSPGASLHMLNAWPVTQGSPAVTIAIVSSGLTESAEFAGRVLPGRHFFGTGQEDGDTSDPTGRGTALAAVAAAAGDDGVGIAGVAWGVKILPVRVPAAGDPFFSLSVARGVEFAANQGADVILVDMALTLLPTQLQAALQQAQAKGALLIAPVGECDFLAAPGCTGAGGSFYPAALPGVLAVTASDRADQIALFANRLNSGQVGAAAPGVALPTGGAGCTAASGTHLAAAHAAGLAALVQSACPQYSAEQVRQTLLTAADDLGAPGYDDTFGHGRLNAARALLAGCPLAP